MFKTDTFVHRNNMTGIVKPFNIVIESSRNAETHYYQTLNRIGTCFILELWLLHPINSC